jgi:SRSO17 transposase
LSLETELEAEKSLLALDEYEVYGWAGRHLQITMSMLVSAFLLTLQQEPEKDAPDHPPTGVPRGLRTLAQRRWIPANSCV